MGPSSTLVIELSDSGDVVNPLVRVFINDYLVKTNQCSDDTECDMKTFMNALNTVSPYFNIIDNIAEACTKK